MTMVKKEQGQEDTRAQNREGDVLSTKTIRSHLLGKYTV